MYRVYLSDLARIQLDLLLEYLEEEWSKETKDKFWKALLKSFRRIEKFPESCPVSVEFPDLHKCVLTKRTSYFYRIKKSEIEIIYIKDNRQGSKEIYNALKHWS